MFSTLMYVYVYIVYRARTDFFFYKLRNLLSVSLISFPSKKRNKKTEIFKRSLKHRDLAISELWNPLNEAFNLNEHKMIVPQ